MPYNPENLKIVLKEIEAEPETLNMANWVTLPDGTMTSPLSAFLHYLPDRNAYRYVEPECGTQMCLGGRMALKLIQSRLDLNGVVEDASMWTITDALKYVGLVDGVDEDYYDYRKKFERVFFRKRIRTAKGLRKALKEQGLL